MTSPAVRHRVASRLWFQVATTATISALLACSPQPAAVQPSAPGPGATAAVPTDVLVVEQSELDAIRTKYILSAPLGEVAAAAACASGQADKACTDAAHQQLRDEAKKRGANLVVILSTAMRQTFPPQLALRAALYEIRPRS